MKKALKSTGLAMLVFLFLGVVAATAQAAPVAPGPGNAISVSIPLSQANGLATPIKLMLVVALLSFLPALLVSVTSFTRIVVVFSFLRQAMGLPQVPPNQVLIGLSLFLTFAIMSPVFGEMYEKGINPYLDGNIPEEAALTATMAPLRRFMFAQTRANDINLMMQIGRKPPVATFDELPTAIMIPAFVLSELKTAFQIGFMLYIPFVVMDIVVAMILLAMGMMVLPPVIISLPFKIMLFVVADGWDLVITSLIKSFR